VMLPTLSISVAVAVVQKDVEVEEEGQVFEEVMSPTELALAWGVKVVTASAMALEVVWVPWMAARVAAIMTVGVAPAALVSAPLVSETSVRIQLAVESVVSEALVAVPAVYWKAPLRIPFLE
jgi:hypothetical protein